MACFTSHFYLYGFSLPIGIPVGVLAVSFNDFKIFLETSVDFEDILTNQEDFLIVKYT